MELQHDEYEKDSVSDEAMVNAIECAAKVNSGRVGEVLRG